MLKSCDLGSAFVPTADLAHWSPGAAPIAYGAKSAGQRGARCVDCLNTVQMQKRLANVESVDRIEASLCRHALTPCSGRDLYTIDKSRDFAYGAGFLRCISCAML